MGDAAVMPDGSPIVPSGVPPNTELAIMVQKLTGPLLAGLLGAGILAAIMSSLDSQFFCLGTMFTNDIVTHYFGEARFDDRDRVRLARCFIVGVVAVTYLLSLAQPRHVFTLGIWCFSGFASLFRWSLLRSTGAGSRGRGPLHPLWSRPLPGCCCFRRATTGATAGISFWA